MVCVSQVSGHMSIVSPLTRLRQKACKFEASLGYIVRLCLKGNSSEHMTYIKITFPCLTLSDLNIQLLA
jgi:hypothetical protein